MPLPKLRPADVFPMKAEGKTMICLRDPEGILEEAVLLTPPAFFVAALLDGKREARDVQVAFAREFEGHLLLESEINEVVKALDERGFLDNESFAARRREAVAGFSAMPIRPFSHAGLSYPAETDRIRNMVSAHMEDAEKAPDGPPPLGLAVPHIDFERGGKAYARAYRRLEKNPLPPLVVILGVAHYAPPAPFMLTRKNFDTPLGIVSTDSAAVTVLASKCGGWLLEHEFAHKGEHSIEFQLIWLKAVRPEDNFKILPVLVSPFDLFTADKPPASDSRISGFLEALRQVTQEREVLVLASVDFSHVGPKFGMEMELDSAAETWMRETDTALLDLVEAGDAEGFWSRGMARGNETNVDALSALYSLMHVLSPAKGKVLAYDKAFDPAGGLVSFAAVEFPRP